MTGNGKYIILSAGVIYLLKRWLLLALALFFAVGAHLRPQWDYEIAGERLVPCGVRASTIAEETAREAAGEILRGAVMPPEVHRRLRLSFRRPKEDARLLSDALLRATEGVVRRDEVRVDGVRLGWVEDGGALREGLRDYIANTLPSWASGGVLTRELSTRPLYTREGYVTDTRDMLLLVTGVAPVFYFDDSGRFARA